MPKTLKNKRAVSPIIATLILILIAVAAGVIVYVWTTTYIGTQVGSFSQEQFIITNAKYDKNAKILNVTIVNQGASIVNITKVTIYLSDYTTVKNTTSPNKGINPGQTMILKLNNIVLQKGTEYIIEASSAKNNTAVFRFTA